MLTWLYHFLSVKHLVTHNKSWLLNILHKSKHDPVRYTSLPRHPWISHSRSSRHISLLWKCLCTCSLVCWGSTSFSLPGPCLCDTANPCSSTLIITINVPLRYVQVLERQCSELTKKQALGSISFLFKSQIYLTEALIISIFPIVFILKYKCQTMSYGET